MHQGASHRPIVDYYYYNSMSPIVLLLTLISALFLFSFFLSDQIRIFTNTFTLTPYNGAEALVCTLPQRHPPPPRPLQKKKEREKKENTFIRIYSLTCEALWVSVSVSRSVFMCVLYCSFGCSSRNRSHWIQWSSTTA